MRTALGVVLPLLLATVLSAQSVPPVKVAVRARSMQPGELVVLSVTTSAPVDTLRARAFERDLQPFRVAANAWNMLVGIDLDVKPGRHVVTIQPGPPLDTSAVTHYLTVRSKEFPTRRLTVDEAFVNPPASVTERIEEEAETIARLWTSTAPRAWTSPFIKPVPHAANSRFGSRSILNGQPRSPHGGADFASPAGTPVRAPNNGTVVLAGDLYYTGGTVAIDHGLGLVSLFAHLSRIDVQTDEVVERGAVVGAVGATGRVTGAHLHWTLRANGARVDPVALLDVLGGTTSR